MTLFDATALLDGEELLALAQYDVEKGNLDTALLKLKVAVSKDDAPIYVKSVIARLYAQLKMPAKAEQLFKEYLAVVPDAITEKFQLGMVSLEQGQRESALVLWSELLEVIPAHPPSLFYSAVAKLEMGDKAEARRNLEVLLQSAAVDNMYYGKAKDLMLALDRGKEVENTPASAKVNPQDVYN